MSSAHHSDSRERTAGRRLSGRPAQRMGASRTFALAAMCSGLLSLSLSACSDDKNRLAKSDDDGSGGATSSSAMSSSVVTASTSGAGGAPTEPAGKTTLTVVNGIVDYPAIRLCFSAFPTGPSPGMQPWPQKATGMPFAQSAAVPLETTVPQTSDVEVWAIAGQLELAAGSDCASLSESVPEGLVVGSLGVLPASVFTEPKSLLLVTSGCLGARKHGGASQELACGIGYTAKTPTATMVAGFVSRINSPATVSMQFVQAGRGVDLVNLRLTPGIDGASPGKAADKWSWGAIVPFPPLNSYSRNKLGDLNKATLDMYPVSSGTAVHTSTIQQAVENSPLSSDDVADGSNIVIVGVGAHPTLGTGSWWNTYRMTMIQANLQ